ncbi:hypothetical protein [Macrococcus capreoli]|uniref:hypothetical protein n=1 Tax=Macrococcus capreoli TaxID=2982690 RepID=UPI003F41B8CE
MTTTVNENNSKLFRDVLKQLKIEGIPYIISFSEDKQRDFAILTNPDVQLYDDIEDGGITCDFGEDGGFITLSTLDEIIKEVKNGK